MAAQVLDFQGLAAMPRTADDSCELMSPSLHRLQHLSSLQALDACSNIPDAAAADFKKVVSLIGCLGHARYRRPPAGHPAAAPRPDAPRSPPFSASKDAEKPQVRFSPLQDAGQPECIEDPLRCKPHFVDRGSQSGAGIVDQARRGSISVPSGVLCGDMHVSHGSSEGKVNDQDANGSVYDATTSPILQKQDLPACSAQKTRNWNLAVPTLASCKEPDQARCTQARCAPLMTNSSFISSLSMEERGGTLRGGKPLFSSARPPLPPKKRNLSEKEDETFKRCHTSGKCHCRQKHRKLQSRSEVRVIAVLTDTMNSEAKVVDDGYSWCMYGHKFVEGFTYPRVYYKCSSVRGCPARKHVQRDSKDESIFTVTYGRRHAHPQILKTGKV